MKKALSFLLLVLSFNLLSGQSRILISKPDLSYVNNTLTVKYDITGCGSGQFVDISLIVINSKGDTIRPAYITGDIGTMVNCGLGKTITWNVIKDNVKIDDDIEVMLIGKEFIPVISNINSLESAKVTRGKVIGASVFVPGLGQKMASGKAGYLAFSGIVYGLGGTSAYFFVKHKKYYTDYQNASGTEADELFTKSDKSYEMAQYMIYGAVGAWVTNMIWSAIIPIKEKPLKKPDLSIINAQGKKLLISAKWTF
jgi:hypothetical protein